MTENYVSASETIDRHESAETALREDLARAFQVVTGYGRAILILGTAAGAGLADQVSKAIVEHSVPYGVKSITVLPGGLWLSHVYNKGIAWGLFSSHPNLVAWIAVATGLFVMGAGLFGRFGWPSYLCALGLIVGGAAGNLFDRVYRPQGVLDFVDLGWWPQFNVADIAVVVGAIVVALAVLRASAIELSIVKAYRRHVDDQGPAADATEQGEA